MSKYFDMHGFPITYSQWSERFESDSRVLGKTEIDGVMVSTVWLGLRHGTDDQGNPYIFETIAFNSIGEDIWLNRYTSLQDALEGHLETVQKYVVEALKFRFGMVDTEDMFNKIDRYLDDGN